MACTMVVIAMMDSVNGSAEDDGLVGQVIMTQTHGGGFGNLVGRMIRRMIGILLTLRWVVDLGSLPCP